MLGLSQILKSLEKICLTQKSVRMSRFFLTIFGEIEVGREREREKENERERENEREIVQELATNNLSRGVLILRLVSDFSNPTGSALLQWLNKFLFRSSKT